MMFSWLMQLTACASAKNRWTASRFPENSERSTLSATRRPRRTCSATKTRPMPPAPICLQQAIRAEHRAHRIGPRGIGARAVAVAWDEAGVSAVEIPDAVIVGDDVLDLFVAVMPLRIAEVV